MIVSSRKKLIHKCQSNTLKYINEVLSNNHKWVDDWTSGSIYLVYNHADI